MVPLDMKGCICHFVKWQIHPLITKGTKYMQSQLHKGYFYLFFRCNGVNNCEDNSDEESCEKFECQLDEFQCNTSCIPMAWVCDNVIDCADGTDESNKKCRAECK